MTSPFHSPFKDVLELPPRKASSKPPVFNKNTKKNPKPAPQPPKEPAPPPASPEISLPNSGKNPPEVAQEAPAPTEDEKKKSKVILLQQDDQETRFVLLKNGEMEEFDSELRESLLKKGNIYWGRVIHVNTSLNAAFVDYGQKKQGFLAFSEIHASYAKQEGATFASHQEGVEATSPVVPGKNLPRRGRQELPIHRHQWVLVQVLKDERGHKGAALTTYISLPGQISVVLPNTPNNSGVSKRVTGAKERKTLKEMIEGLKIPQDQSIILRSGALGQDLKDVKKDYQNLLRLWRSFFKKSPTEPVLMYEEQALGLRIVRDYFRADIEVFWVEGQKSYEQISDCVKKYLPKSYSDILRQYKSEKRHLFDVFGLEDALRMMYQPKVPLTSGGYLIIDQTEALVAIDVNSGKSGRDHAGEDVALKTNLEACSVIAQQVRLRKLSGQIVVDFIDVAKDHYEIIEKTLNSYLKKDKARIKVGSMNEFCLLVFSRQQVRQSLQESHTVSCVACQGTGRNLITPVGINQVLYALEMACRQIAPPTHHGAITPVSIAIPETPVFFLWVNASLAVDLLNLGRHRLKHMEETYGVVFKVALDTTLSSYEIRIDAPAKAEEEAGNDGASTESSGVSEGVFSSPFGTMAWQNPEKILEKPLEGSLEEASVQFFIKDNVTSSPKPMRSRTRSRKSMYDARAQNLEQKESRADGLLGADIKTSPASNMPEDAKNKPPQELPRELGKKMEKGGPRGTAKNLARESTRDPIKNDGNQEEGTKSLAPRGRRKHSASRYKKQAPSQDTVLGAPAPIGLPPSKGRAQSPEKEKSSGPEPIFGEKTEKPRSNLINKFTSWVRGSKK